MFLTKREFWMMPMLDADGTEGAANPEAESEDAQGEGTAPENAEKKKEAETKEPKKMFSQEDVGNFVAKEMRKAQEKMLRDLGVEEFTDVKDGLKKHGDAQQAMQQKLGDSNETIAQLNTRITEMQEQLAISRAGVRSEHVPDALVLAREIVSDDVTLEDALSQVVAKFPQMKSEDATGAINPPGQSTPEPEPATVREAISQKVAMARNIKN